MEPEKKTHAQKIIEAHYKDVVKILFHLAKNKDIWEDSLQAGLLGLLESEKNWNPSKGDLITFAQSNIRGKAIEVYWKYKKNGLTHINKDEI